MKEIITDLSTSYRFLYPRLTIIVSSGTIEHPNALTIAWSSPLSVIPPLIGISIAKKRYSYEIIKKNRDFVINIPNYSQIDESYYIGQISGRNQPKKIQLSGFSVESSNKVKAPRIRECQINLECKLVDIFTTGDHDLFIGEVLELVIDPNIKGVWASDLNKFKPIYWRQSKFKEETYTFNSY